LITNTKLSTAELTDEYYMAEKGAVLQVICNVASSMMRRGLRTAPHKVALSLSGLKYIIGWRSWASSKEETFYAVAYIVVDNIRHLS
jgi:hypothetical protein